MDKLPSKNIEKLLIRIQRSENGKLSLSSLSDDDLDRLRILSDRGLIRGCDSYFPENDPNSSVIFIGPLSRSVTLTTAGTDYLSELSEERKTLWLRFGRDLLMLILGALITLVGTFLFNKLTGGADPEDHIPVSENRPAFVATPSDNDAPAGE